jgi:hypothetical protein
VACTGTCTWTFSSGMWSVTASSCSTGCVCVDAIATSYSDPSDPVNSLLSTLAGPNPLIDPSVRALIEVLDNHNNPIGDIKAHVAAGGKISKYSISKALMLHRLHFLDNLPATGPAPSKAELDAQWQSSASSMITTALKQITAGSTSVALPCGPPQ